MNTQPKLRPFKLTAIALALSATSTLAYADAHQTERTAPQHAEQSVESSQHHEKYTDSAARNAWLDGKLESAYLFNRHLNNFTINTKVVDGKAQLSGKVESDIDRSLAEEVALSIKGIDGVENNLEVSADGARNESTDGEVGFAQRMEDLTTTATVKAKLLMNGATEGTDINVDTSNAVVTLSGDVDSAEEKALAQKIAENTDDVREVNNTLTVSEG